VSSAEYVALLSAWESLHAVIDQHLRAATDDLNRQTLAVLERSPGREDEALAGSPTPALEQPSDD